MTEKCSRRYKLVRIYYYASALLPLEAFIAPVVVLFYTKHVNISFLQYSNFIAALFIFNMAFEVPSGMLSDYVGRRRAWVIGQGVYVVGLSILTVCPKFWALIPSGIFLCAGQSLASGNLQAIGYEAYVAVGKSQEFKSLLGRTGAIAMGVSAAAAYIGGSIADINIKWPMILDITMLAINVCLATTTLLLLWPKENKMVSNRESPILYELKKLGSAKYVLLLPDFQLPLFISVACFMILRVSLNFYQPILTDRGWNGEDLGILFTTAILITSVLSFLSSRHFMHRVTIAHTSISIILILLICAFFFAIDCNSIPFILAFLLHQVIRVLVPAVTTYAQQSVMTEGYPMRTTVVSFGFLVRALVASFGMFISGYFVDHGSTKISVIVSLHIIVAILLTLAKVVLEYRIKKEKRCSARSFV